MSIDTIIIGSGIAGLYTAYKLLKQNKTDFLVLEQNSYVGGRVKMENFAGVQVVKGAGIGRYKKDKYLKKLLKELGLEVKKTSVPHYYSEKFNYKESCKKIIYDILDKIKTFNNKKSGSFRDIIDKNFREGTLCKFKNCSGFSDYIEEDFRETIHHYGMDDNVGDFEGFYIQWQKMLDILTDKIEDRILLGIKVKSICKTHDGGEYKIYTNKGPIFAKKIIVATDISTVKKIFPGNMLYNYISGQSFSRIYAKFDEKSTEIMKKYVKGYTIVPGILQKIIPIQPDKGIYMIGYNDNQDADNSKRDFKNNKKYLEETLEWSLNIPENSLNIELYKIYYWNIGTHYYKPYFWKFSEWKKYQKMMQTPDKNVYVVGELVSFNQGWVEGALESVENIFNFL